MKAAGRPLRFLGCIMGGWVGLRAASLLAPAIWSIAHPIAPASQLVLRSLRDDGRPVVATPSLRVPSQPASQALAMAGPNTLALRSLTRSSPTGAYGPVPIAGLVSHDDVADLLLGATVSFARPRIAGGLVDRLGEIIEGDEGRGETIRAGGARGVVVAPRTDGSSRWSGTAWLLWRPEVGNGFVNAPLLGGSQAGARLNYRLTDKQADQLSLYGRVSRAFAGPSSEEAALGLAWRPGKLPVSLLVERRARLGPGGRDGFAALAAGGVGPRQVARNVEIEGYAQAGFVGERLEDGFADGKASMGYRLTPPAARRSLSLGASLSGSVQPGAGRIDVGPELRFRLPVGTSGLRVSTEWHARIAGEARPANGPAITLVADF